MSRRTVLATVALFALSCRDAPTTSLSPVRFSASVEGEGSEASGDAHIDLREQRAALLATDRAYAAAAVRTNLVEAIVAPLAEDGIYVILGPSPGVARGAEATRQVLAANPNNALSTFSWTAIRVDVSSDGTRGYTYGYTELTLPSGAVVPGKYHAYWAKQVDGSWRIAAYKRVARAAGFVSYTPPPGFGTPEYKHYRYFPNTVSAVELEAIKGEDRAFSDFAQIVGNGDAFAAYAAEDGANAAGARSATWLFGREAMRILHSTDPLGGFYWVPDLGDVAASGDLGFTVGRVLVDVRNTDGTTTTVIIGEYFTIWKKQLTGEWRFVVDG